MTHVAPLAIPNSTTYLHHSQILIAQWTPIRLTRSKPSSLIRSKNLEWFYFNIDLNDTLLEPQPIPTAMHRAGPATKADEQKDLLSMSDSHRFLKQIESDLDSYVYKGNDPSPMRNILRSLLSFAREKPSILREVARRIYDLNDIPNRSKALEGQLGQFNTKDNRRRNRQFYKKMLDDNFRADPENVTIVAEGDSWFQYPSLFSGFDPVKDVIDWLIDDDRMAVFSLAAGGDWLSNILYTGEYIEALPRIAPDVLLISGGGNDMVGDMRLATMVRSPRLVGRRDLKDPKQAAFARLVAARSKDERIDGMKYQKGLVLLADEFFDFLNLAMTQYFLFFYNLVNNRRYRKMLIITQGYDHVQPGPPKGSRSIKQRILNAVMKNGKWLHNPLNIKGITDPEEQEAVLYAMITEFNEMLTQLAGYHAFPNVFHIDCRGLAKPGDWFDELHLKNHANRSIAHTFKSCIWENLHLTELPKQKVYRVADFVQP